MAASRAKRLQSVRVSYQPSTITAVEGLLAKGGPQISKKYSQRRLSNPKVACKMVYLNLIQASILAWFLLHLPR